MDQALIPEGVKRCPFPLFALWLLAIFAVIGWGVYAGVVILLKGLNVTGLNDYFGFGLWITADLGIIALGAGAFFSGFLFYGLSRFFPALKELKKIINLAVIVGFICYSGAMLVLVLDIGQPIRGWFGYWYANVHSMLTEVIFCITLLLYRADHRICSDHSGKSQTGRQQAATPAWAQLPRNHGVVCLDRHLFELLPSGVLGGHVWGAFCPPFCIPERLFHLALDLLSLHPLRHCRRTGIHGAHLPSDGKDHSENFG